MVITAGLFKDLVPACPNGQIQLLTPLFAEILPVYHIDTPARIGAFIAECAYESANFTHFTEIDPGTKYEGDKALGNIYPGDGPRFKGRGLIQVTGRNNYHDCSLKIYGDLRLLKSPELLAQSDGAVRSGCWYFTKPILKDGQSILNFCDMPETYTHIWNEHSWTKVQWISIMVNGGLNGIAQRTANYQRAQKVLGF